MTNRERWLLASLILAGLLVLCLGFWQQARYTDAQQAVRRYLTQEAAKSDGEETAQDVLRRQAVPELRRALVRGDFDAARKRLDALDAETRTADDLPLRGKAIPLDQLWPAKSKPRAHAREVLLTLVRKQQQGYDVGRAQEALVAVADAARSGKKDDALAQFKSVEAALQSAALRPGFKLPSAPEAHGAPPAPGAPWAAGGRFAAAQLERQLQMFRLALPQLMEKATPEQRLLLQRLQPLVEQIAAASREGKDVRPVFPIFQQTIGAYQEQDYERVDRLLVRARKLLTTLKPLPAGQRRVPAPNGPAPTPGPAAIPGGLTPDAVMQQMDRLRAVPEPEYRAQRAQVAAALAQALSAALARPRMAGGSPAGGSPRAGPGMVAGDAAGLQVVVSSAGQILELRSRGLDLTAGAQPGGVSLGLPGKPDVPLRGIVREDGKALVQRVSGAQGGVVVSYRAADKDVAIQVKAKRVQDGTAGQLVLRLPLRAAGWRWTGVGDPQVIAVDGTYQADAANGTFSGVTLLGAAIGLKIEAPTAAVTGYDPRANVLIVRLPVSGARGESIHTVRLTLVPGSRR